MASNRQERKRERNNNEPFAWRNKRPILPLESFEHEQVKERSPFNANDIWSISSPRMSGWTYKMAPADIRDALHQNEINEDQREYFGEVFSQFDAMDFKLFIRSSGATVYEIARCMAQCNINNPLIIELINKYSTDYDYQSSLMPPYIFNPSMYHSFSAGIK